ncbi:unnamed protein product [Paramecium pentaurelia]|uniref:WD repeat-containing protein 65 n=3 Tax=Paramecium TaxID=5884 RepID=A0A8S1UB52_9CILI|nr:unnamed protein product [Paramecium pentaurelia]
MDDKKRRNEDRRLKLDVIQSYGSLCSAKFKDSISIIEDEQRRLLYPVGKFIAQKFIDKPDTQFIRLSDNLDIVSCMTVAPNKRTLAVAEKMKNETVPQLVIYNLKAHPSKMEAEKKPYKYLDTKSSTFISMAFSHTDSRFLLCLTGPPDYLLIFVDLIRMKHLALSAIGQELTRVSISPKDNHMVAVSGKNYFKILRVQENSFISLTDQIKRLAPIQTFTDHAWFEENKVILANDKAEIFIIHDNDVRQYINNAFTDIRGPGVSSLIAFSKGFLVGSDSGHFALWIRGDDHDKQKTEDGIEVVMDLQFLKKWRCERKSQVVSMDITKQEDLVAVAFSNNDICTIEMGQVLPNSTEVLESYKNNEKFLKREVKFDFLFNGFHNAPITHLDVCLQRPLIVTASKYDSTIRIWNYAYPRCELARKFYLGDDGNQQGLGTKENQSTTQDISPLCSVGFHPTGYYLAAGFQDKLRIFHVLHSELRAYKEMAVKCCTQVKFSQGGHMLAVAYPRAKSNHYYINIYDAYTMEFMHTLKGHSNQITDLIWGIKDTFLASCGLDGSIFEWNPNDWSRKDYVYNTNKYTSLIYDPPIGMLIAAGTESIKDKTEQDKIDTKYIVREQRIVQNGISTGKDHHFHDLGQQKLTQLAYIQSLYNQFGIIGGTENGQIKIYSYIFNQMAFETMPVHQGEITRIKCSPDGRYVFSTGTDGVLFIYQVSEISNDGQIYASKTGAEAKEQMDDIDKINPKAGVVDENLADVLLVSRNEIETYIAEMKKLHNDLQDLDQKTDFKVQEEKRKVEKEKLEIEKQMNNEIAAWAARYDQLKAQKSAAEKESANLFKNVENNHLKAVEELENLYERKLAFENEKYLQLEQDLMEERRRNQAQAKEFESKHTSYIEELKEKFYKNFQITAKALENNQNQADQLKATYEEILAQQEEDHEFEIKDLNDRQKKEIDRLKCLLAEKDSKFKQEQKLVQELRLENEKLDKRLQEKEQAYQLLEKNLKEAETKIDVQCKDLEDKDDQLKKKDKKISEYKDKINVLQKSKHVLSFRTTEMKKSLEPKEAQIEKLKEELFRLESEFAKQLKINSELNSKINEETSKTNALTHDLNLQIQTTKKKENIIQNITRDIHNCVHYIDDKEWKKEMTKLYQRYVLQQEIKQSSNDPRSIEEMNRHINHLEKSAIQINSSTEKMMVRREKEIYKRTSENQQLIHELNEIRKQCKDYETEKSNLKIENDKYKKENEKFKQEIKVLQTKLGKNIGEQNVEMMNEDVMQQSQQPILPQALNINKQGSAQARLQSLPQKNNKMGKILRGPNFDKQKLQPFEFQKNVELQNQLQIALNQLQANESMIKNFRKILKEKGIEDPYADAEQEHSQFGRPLSSIFGSRV